MEITNIKIVLAKDPDKNVKAFCTVTFDDCFVVRDMKIIEGEKGLFVAMPSRRQSERCGNCHRKNPVGVPYCSWCGVRLAEVKTPREASSLYVDIAHPSTSECRRMIEEKLIEAYREALASPPEASTPSVSPSSPATDGGGGSPGENPQE